MMLISDLGRWIQRFCRTNHDAFSLPSSAQELGRILALASSHFIRSQHQLDHGSGYADKAAELVVQVPVDDRVEQYGLAWSAGYRFDKIVIDGRFSM